MQEREKNTNKEKVDFRPPYSNRSMLILSQGRLGKEEGIKGSLSSGNSFAHVKHDLICLPLIQIAPATKLSYELWHDIR